MKFNIPTAIFASGVATLVFLLITKGKIPLYYGSSFSYIPAVAIVGSSFMGQAAFNDAVLIDKTLMGPIQIAIMLSGLVSILAGFIVNKFGQEKVDRVLPPTVLDQLQQLSDSHLLVVQWVEYSMLMRQQVC